MTAVSGQPSSASGVHFKAPDGGWGWVVVFSSFIIHMIMDGITYSMGTYLTLFTEEFQVSHGAASIIHSLLPAVTFLTGPIASALTNRFGCRTTTMIGSVVGALGFILSFFVKKFVFLYITVGVIVGLGFGLIYVPAIVSVGYYFEKRRSFAMGIAVCGTGVGTFLLSPANRLLTERYGWQGAFLIKAAFVLNGCVCGALLRPVPIEPSEVLRLKKLKKKLAARNPNETKTLIEREMIEIKVTEPVKTSSVSAVVKSLPALNNERLGSTKRQRNCSETHKTPVHSMSSLSMLAQTRSMQNIPAEQAAVNATTKCSFKRVVGFFDFSLFKDLVFMFFAVSNFMTSLGFNAPFIYIVDQATNANIDPHSADWLLSAIGISNTVGRIVLGLIADLKGVNRLYLYSTVLTICGIATVIEPFFPSFTGLLVYAIVFGFTSGGYVSITSILLVDLLGLERLTNAFGILLVFQGVATAIGPPTVGFMYDAFKSYVFPFGFTGVMIAISGAMCFFIPCLTCQKKPNVPQEEEEE